MAINLIYEAFRKGDLKSAQFFAAQERSQSLENENYLIALHYATYWINQLKKLEGKSNNLEKSSLIFQEYADFVHRYIPSHNMYNEEMLYHIRYFLFNLSLTYLNDELVHLSDKNLEREILLNIIRCYKLIGDYRKALSLLELHFSESGLDDADCLAEFADCLEMISENEKSRLLFRDAFYSAPQTIEIDFLLSPMISNIRKHLSQYSLSNNLVKEWMGVYGVLLGYLNVRRKLNPFEVSRLKQEITNLKLEWAQNRDSNSPIYPRLIYRYFLLLDHYKEIKEDRTKWDEILLSLKMIDPIIYEMYTKI